MHACMHTLVDDGWRDPTYPASSSTLVAPSVDTPDLVMGAGSGVGPCICVGVPGRDENGEDAAEESELAL